MKRKKRDHRQQTQRPRQRKGEKLLMQLAELDTLSLELAPRPAAGEDILSFRRRSA